MDDEKLILLVKKRKEIYDRRNHLHKYQECKNNAWTYIARKMGASETDCIKRWRNLRDRYSRELRINGNIDVWPFTLMDFIKPHIINRLRWKKRPTELRDNRLSPPEPVHSQTDLVKASPVTSPVNCKETEFTQILDDSQIFEESLISSSTLRKKSKISANTEVDKGFCKAVETLKKACAQYEARKANSAIYAFGDMIVATIYKMNSCNQIKVMQQVTDLVMRIKLEEDEQTTF